jgi:hypothetical protein
MLVLDELIAEGKVPRPDFLKLDVQGYELEVLKGGERALSSTRAVLLEVSFIPFFERMPVALDVVNFMAARGFMWYDVLGIYRRRSDDALMQMDVMFVPKADPLRRSGDD